MKQLFLLCISLLLVSADKFLRNEQKNAESLSIAMRGITEKFAKNNERIEYFILENNSTIQLLTYIWYSAEKCSEPQLIEVNSFNKTTNRWRNSEFEVKKFYNFHGCQLVFGVPTQRLENFTLTEEILYHETYLTDSVFSLANNLNFTYLTNPSVEDRLTPEFTGITYVNKSLTVDLDIYENKWLPYDETTWFLICIIFIASFTTILTFRLFKESVAHFAFGSNVLTPALNVVMIFFGISQVVLPRGNFARFLVMLFILYSMIIRTAWQSKMFEFLQKEMLKPEIKSFEEAIEKGYKLWLMESEGKALQTSELWDR